VIELTKEVAIELAPYKINVNSIGPGVIKTDMTRQIESDPQARRQTLARIPLGRFGEPEDIANAAAFLASDETDYITGEILFVDGGWLAL
jgi:NAD(P)-dependent dehydrogenase (short-subunit alcohol dehydrogenase family)